MVICDLGREYSAAADVTFVYIYLYCICSIGLLRPCDVLLWRLFLFLRNYPYDLISKLHVASALLWWLLCDCCGEATVWGGVVRRGRSYVLFTFDILSPRGGCDGMICAGRPVTYKFCVLWQ